MPFDLGLAAHVLDKPNKVAAIGDETRKLLVLAALPSDDALKNTMEAGAAGASRNLSPVHRFTLVTVPSIGRRVKLPL